MVLSWALFLLWLILNMLDIVISRLAAQAGAMVAGLLYPVSSSWLAVSINRMMLAILIGLLLAYFKKNTWLSLLTLGMLGICIWDSYSLLKLVR